MPNWEHLNHVKSSSALHMFNIILCIPVNQEHACPLVSPLSQHWKTDVFGICTLAPTVNLHVSCCWSSMSVPQQKNAVRRIRTTVLNYHAGFFSYQVYREHLAIVAGVQRSRGDWWVYLLNSDWSDGSLKRRWQPLPLGTAGSLLG